MKNNVNKSKRSGTILTEALISLFVLGTLFVSITTAVTVSISNTKRLQEVNETSAYAQKITDCIYSIAQSDSTAFFDEIEKANAIYIEEGDFSKECLINLDTIAQELEFRKESSEENIVTLYDVLNFTDDDPTNPTGTKEMTDYSVKLYLLPSETTEVHKSLNYFVSYNPLLTNGQLDGGRIYNTEQLDEIYTFKLVVSKTVNTLGTATTDFTQSSPATVTYIFQISSNGR